MVIPFQKTGSKHVYKKLHLKSPTDKIIIFAM